MKKKSLIFVLLFLFSLTFVSADTRVDDSYCGDMSDAGCNPGYIPACFDSSQGYYYTCVWDDSQDCSSDPSKSLDCSRWCDSGWVYDYSHQGTDYGCCPQATPYLKQYSDGTYGCSNTAQASFDYDTSAGYCVIDFGSVVIFADNYYTRHTACGLFYREGWCDIGQAGSPIQGETKCEGLNFLQCVEDTTFIGEWENQGKVIGLCGYFEGYCESNFDCPLEILTTYYCYGGNIVTNQTMIECVSNECQSVLQYENQLEEECLLGCTQEGTAMAFCNDEPPPCTSDADCPEIGSKCVSGVCVIPQCTTDVDCESGKKCDNGVCVTIPLECTSDSDCQEGFVCQENKCVEGSSNVLAIILIVVVGLVLIGGLTFLYVKMRGR